MSAVALLPQASYRKSNEQPMLSQNKYYELYACTRPLGGKSIVGSHCFLEIRSNGEVEDSLSFGPGGYDAEKVRLNTTCEFVAYIGSETWAELEQAFRVSADEGYRLFGIKIPFTAKKQANHCCACASGALAQVLPEVPTPTNFQEANYGHGVKS